MQAQQLYQGRCALHALASGAWQRAGVGWCVLQLMQVQPGRYQLIGRDSANTQQVSGSIGRLWFGRIADVPSPACSGIAQHVDTRKMRAHESSGQFLLSSRPGAVFLV
eukprot:COSAG02_NODE_1619_length_11636_cov_26.969836_4_plen_108_part_00